MSNPRRTVEIRLMFDWGTGPFWVSVDGDLSYDCCPNEISEVVPLSDELIAAVAEWDERMQRTYNDEVPQDSGILDPEQEARWKADGRELARRLKAEVGADVRVEYAPLGGPVEVVR
ncbi:hypothetical protein SacmaDRAFT_0447 [Saccharomonospora marina XMU15]|uniref:Uncharacterized protein n=1 Tax=Saccharomonospora marina XMU15 TaxID=882083 RepID=H5X379_9PSEU|nr:hypothetical protein [Saccharomonospora marina]EHR48748.1 hypothetical protein SacmaDRAFT_0447 [Saccharomonospora marina XMU15]